ncbi:MAG: LLM class flavin-dependent oxidoreductase [Armatimonadetes bacterium]|nr:LLM class flavin-dependent oxidoreductase [Armatimonadota bacterium]
MASQIRYGLSLPNRGVTFGAGTPDQFLVMAETAEASGYFDAVFTGDSLIAKPRLDCIVLLSAVASRTRRVLLGTSCMASFIFRHPIVLANQWAALDQVSGGRTYLVACMGGGPTARAGAPRSPSGARWQIEFDAMGMTTKERAGRMVEGMEILRRLWTENEVTHEGKYYRFERVALDVKPLQRSCPIAIASNPRPPYATEADIERAFRRVARIGDGWQIDHGTPEEFGARWRRILGYAKEYGRADQVRTSMIHLYVNIQRDREAAFAEGRKFYETYHKGTFPEEFLRVRLTYGTPEDVVARIRQFEAAGCNLPIIRFASWDQMGQMRLALQEVMPRLGEGRAA